MYKTKKKIIKKQNMLNIFKDNANHSKKSII